MDLTAKIPRKSNINFLGAGLLIIICGLAGFFLYRFIINAKLKNCVFVEKKLCFQGKRYEKYNWQNNSSAKAFQINKPQKIKAPFNGYFVYSPSALINFERQRKGETPVIVFRHEKGNKIKLYVAKVNLIKGKEAEYQEVKKDEIVAEIFPGEIDFLDNYSAVRVNIPKKE